MLILSINYGQAHGVFGVGNSLWFITLLQEKPWAGFLIGLAFAAFMFGSKNLVVYFYSRNQEKKRRAEALSRGGEQDPPAAN